MATATADLGEHRYADLGEVRLHYVERGEGPLVLLLHGFPEFWFEWRKQIPALADAGFRVVAPDMRGYNLSSKPKGVGNYNLEKLAGDVRDLIHHLGEERAVVVGHDWGAAVAWGTATYHPDVVERLAILNVPHPKRMTEGLRMPKQLAKSWYMFFFQLPFAPEQALSRGDYAVGRRLFKGDPRPPFSDDEIERYVEAWRQPGALTAMLNYYRAAFRQDPRKVLGMPRIEAETLVIWGEQDTALSKELAEPPRDLVPNVRVEYFPNATHWVANDEAESVNRLLIDFARGA